MWTIIDKSTRKVLFATVLPFEETENETAIEQTYLESIPEGHELFFDFETEIFYLNQ